MSASLNISYQDSYDINTDGILSQEELLSINIDTGNNTSTTLGSYISESQTEGASVSLNIDFGNNQVQFDDNQFQYEGVNVNVTESNSNSSADCYTPNDEGNGIMEEQWLKNIINDLLKSEGVDTIPDSMKDDTASSNNVTFKLPTTISMKDDIIDGNINLWTGAQSYSSEEVLDFLASDENLSDEDIIKYFGDYGHLGDLESMMGLEQGALLDEYSSYTS